MLCKHEHKSDDEKTQHKANDEAWCLDLIQMKDTYLIHVVSRNLLLKDRKKELQTSTVGLLETPKLLTDATQQGSCSVCSICFRNDLWAILSRKITTFWGFCGSIVLLWRWRGISTSHFATTFSYEIIARQTSFPDSEGTLPTIIPVLVLLYIVPLVIY